MTRPEADTADTGHGPLVSVRGLRVAHRAAGFGGRPVTAVEDVSFDIGRGETFALVGESGCGKTTTARALLRLIDASAGTLRYDGRDLAALRGEALRRQRRRMQIVFQDPYTSLNPWHTVGDIVGEGLIVHGLARGDAAAARVGALLDEVGLPRDYVTRRPRDLSGGERQRVAIARALAVDPEFLVLDEAVSALDVTTQAQVLALIARLRDARHLTCLFIAHNLAVVQQVATTVAVMYRGRIVEQAPAHGLFARPRHPYTRALLDAVPVSDPRDRHTRVDLPPDAGAAPEPGCPFHPRCPHPAKDATCRAAAPPLQELEPGHLVACTKVTAAGL
ncbi:MAG TPA: oligopeptide/dipeptide ABC transporter ATP-binding protein [Gemmatimonadaceae bacterium]|nr:oligopeptide/dipeptide ABC transporter ATP-binding protein [Gemmatimonadaceae bacterium]